MGPIVPQLRQSGPSGQPGREQVAASYAGFVVVVALGVCWGTSRQCYPLEMPGRRMVTSLTTTSPGSILYRRPWLPSSPLSVASPQAADRPSGFRSTKSPDVKFRALVTEGGAEILFHRKEFGQLGEYCIA
jgi:hypothetical protein